MAQASAHLDAGRYVEAVAILKELADKQPDDVVVMFNLALARTLAGQDLEAIDGFRRVLALKEDLHEAQVNLGQLLVKTGRDEEAIPLLESAVQAKPNESKPHYLLGRALSNRQRWARAAAEWERASELEPANSELKLELAAVYEKAQQPDKAAAMYKLFQDDPAARERLGLLQLNKGEFGPAIDNLEAARAKAPTPALLYALATAYLRNLQKDQATLVAADLVALEPDNTDMRMFLGRLLRDQKKYDEAAKHFHQVTKAKPDSGEAWNELTSMLILLKQYEPALAALERARTLNGETPAYHYFRATMLDASSQPKPALESYQRFLAVSEGKYPDEEFKARQRVKVLGKAVRR
jgi:tetratricopeptide (TPR) repeat protein